MLHSFKFFVDAEGWYLNLNNKLTNNARSLNKTTASHVVVLSTTNPGTNQE